MPDIIFCKNLKSPKIHNSLLRAFSHSHQHECVSATSSFFPCCDLTTLASFDSLPISEANLSHFYQCSEGLPPTPHIFSGMQFDTLHQLQYVTKGVSCGMGPVRDSELLRLVQWKSTILSNGYHLIIRWQMYYRSTRTTPDEQWYWKVYKMKQESVLLE